jgi:hypothetical protein
VMMAPRLRSRDRHGRFGSAGGGTSAVGGSVVLIWCSPRDVDLSPPTLPPVPEADLKPGYTFSRSSGWAAGAPGEWVM